MKWYFPYGKDLEKEAVNNARIETFRDDIVASLAREISQNSIDEVVDSQKPVHIKFELLSIDIDKIPDLVSYENLYVPYTRDTWKGDKDAAQFLNNFSQVIEKKEISVLKISDFNTTGLENKKWDSLVLNTGTSHKEKGDSQGSFGIGKAAPFAASALRMVFYESMSRNGEYKAMGVNKFPSFDFYNNGDLVTAQGVGYLGEAKKIFSKESFNFSNEERTEPGTDIYIIGFNQVDDWEKQITKSILKNFLYSINLSKLSFDINGIEISSNNIKTILSQFKDDKDLVSTLNYFSILDDEGQVKIELDERFDKYGFKKSDAVLMLNKREVANRSVMMTRSSGMKIKDLKRISGSIQFNGIFHATGLELNKILKKMENPNHDDWIPSRYEESPERAENLLRDIFQFVKKNVLENFEEVFEQQVNAFGVSDFLPMLDNESADKSEKERNFRHQNIILEEKKVSKFGNSQNTSEDERQARELFKLIDGNELGKSIRNGEGEIDEENPNSRIGDYGESTKQELSEEGISSEGKVKKEEINDINVRIIEHNVDQGMYKIILNSKRNIDDLFLETIIKSELDSSYGVKVVSAELNSDNILYENLILVKNFLKEKSYILDIKLELIGRHKVEVKAYENKK